jgi:hypothetical protein
MGILFVLAAILGLLCPPLAAIAMLAMIAGAFAKGVIGSPPEKIVAASRKARRRRRVKRTGVADHMGVAPQGGNVIDAHWYPVLPLLRLPTPVPEGPTGSH